MFEYTAIQLLKISKTQDFATFKIMTLGLENFEA